MKISNNNNSLITLLFFIAVSLQQGLTATPTNDKNNTVATGKQMVMPVSDDLAPNSCGADPDLSADKIEYRVAMGAEDFKGSWMTEMCGKCVHIKGPTGEVTATIISSCGKNCVPGTIQLNAAAVQKISNGSPEQGLIPVEWNVVPCTNGTTFTNTGNSTFTNANTTASPTSLNETAEASVAAVNGPVGSATTTTKTITAVVSMLNFAKCGGQGSPTKPEQLQKLLFQTEDPKSASLISQTKFCSRGKQLISKDSVVIEIEPPCDLFQSVKCQLPFGADADKLQDLAEEGLKKKGLDPAKFNGFWMLLDKSQSCAFDGIASIGMRTDKRGKQVSHMLVDRDAWDVLLVWIHELGHNLGLHHANAKAGIQFERVKRPEYADHSGFMGNPYGTHPCPNIAHMVAIGWAQPKQVPLNSFKNTWKEFKIPSLDKNPDEGLELTGDPTGSKFYISLRSTDDSFYKDGLDGSKSPYANDGLMQKEYAHNIHIHSIDQTKLSTLLSVIPTGKTERVEDAKLSVKFMKFDEAKNAIVQVCSSDSPSGCPP